jgi:hypothetical protein
MPGFGIRPANEVWNHSVDHIDGDRKSDSRRAAGFGDDGRVHSDQATGGIEQRAARIARIDGCVGLNEVVHLPRLPTGKAPMERADDPRCERLLEPERVADRKGALSHFKISRGTDCDRTKHGACGIELKQREIVVGRHAHDPGLHELTRCEPDAYGAGPLHDVIVRYDVACLVPDQP